MSDADRPNITLTWEEARMVLGALDTASHLLGEGDNLVGHLEAVESIAMLSLKIYGGYMPDSGELPPPAVTDQP